MLSRLTKVFGLIFVLISYQPYELFKDKTILVEW